MRGKKYRVQINFLNEKTMFFDTSKEKEIDEIKEAFEKSTTTKEFLLYARDGKGYEMVDWTHKNERRIGFQ
jgi:hypothetical protein